MSRVAALNQAENRARAADELTPLLADGTALAPEAAIALALGQPS